MPPAHRIKTLSVLHELFIPDIQLALDVRASGRTQHRVSLPQDVSIPLQYLKVSRFHVKQGPIDKPAPVFAPLEERFETLGGNHHDRKSSSQQ